MKDLETIELFIDEKKLNDGVEALSLVEEPATEEMWVALNRHKIEFKSINDEKRIIIGLVLVPEKKIYRRNGDHEFNIVFSKDTVEQAARLYLKRLKNNNTTLEHKEQVKGVSVVESWTVEDPKRDKTAIYKLAANVGSWAVIMKVDDDKIWQDVKAGKYLGISIEGMFSDIIIKHTEEEVLLEKIKVILNE